MVNIVVVGCKFGGGLWGKSGGMIGDGVEWLWDLIRELIVMVFVGIWRKGEDKGDD